MVRLKAVLPGLTPTQLQQLPRQVVKDALDTLKDLDFGESQVMSVVAAENLALFIAGWKL